MPSREGNQFNNLRRGKNLASVPETMKILENIKQTQRNTNKLLLEQLKNNELIDFSFNDYVFVKMNPLGQKLRDEHVKKLGLDPKEYPLKTNSEGFTRIQLRDLISVFGEEINNLPVGMYFKIKENEGGINHGNNKEQTDFNFNYDVLVKINPLGQKLRDEHVKKLGLDPKEHALKTNPEGFTKIQLRKLISVFGKEINPFEENPVEMNFKIKANHM